MQRRCIYICDECKKMSGVFLSEYFNFCSMTSPDIVCFFWECGRGQQRKPQTTSAAFSLSVFSFSSISHSNMSSGFFFGTVTFLHIYNPSNISLPLFANLLSIKWGIYFYFTILFNKIISFIKWNKYLFRLKKLYLLFYSTLFTTSEVFLF